MTVTFCRKCQGLIEPGQAFCTRCFTVVQQTSLLRRVWSRIIEWCGGKVGVAGVKGDDASLRSSTNITLRTSEKFTVHDQSTGELRHYTSINDLPPELRATVQSALQQQEAFDDNTFVTKESITKRITTGPSGEISREITVRDADGVEQRYNSVDELPPELRQKFEQFRKQ